MARGFLARAVATCAGAAVATWGLWHFAAVVRELFGALVIDDAYITFRYAEHWAEGHGPTWNVGEPPVEGYTTPLLVAVLAAGAAVGLPTVAFAKAVGIASGLCAIGATGALVWRATGSVAWSLVAVGVLAGNPAHAVWSASGMETALYGALAAAAALALHVALAAPARPAPWAALAVVLALLALTRTEGLLFAGVLALLGARMRRDGRLVRPLAAVLGSVAAVVLVHLALRRSYYGLWLPLPVYEKGEPFAGLGVVASFLRMYAPYLALAVIGLLAERRGVTARTLHFCALSVVLLSLVVLNVDPVMAMWQRYHAPLLPFVVAGATIGLRACAIAAPRLAVVPLLLAVLAAGRGEYGLGASREALLGEVGDYDRWVSMGHLELGRWLGAHVVNRDVQVALCDAGVIPYYSRLRVIDLWGLNDAHIARHGVDADYVFGKRPELLVLTPMPPDRVLREDARLAREYEQFGEIMGIYELELYRRRDFRLRPVDWPR